MKTITVLGWYGKRNCGDESYQLSFPLVFKNYKFRFTDKISAEDEEVSDAFILGGGDVLAQPFLKQLKKIKKPKHIVSVSANLAIEPEDLKDFKHIVVRDYHSLEILMHKGIRAMYAPDVSFILKGNAAHGKELVAQAFEKEKRELYEHKIGVVINGYLAEDHSKGFNLRDMISFHDLSYKLAHMMDHTNASFVFIPFGEEPPWDDRVTNLWVANKAKFWRKNLPLWTEPSVQNVMDIVAGLDALISTRLHSTIFAIAGKTPFLDIVHNHKNKWLLDTVGKEHFSMNYRCIDEDLLSKKLDDLIANNRAHTKEISTLLDKQVALLRGLGNVCLTEPS